MKSGPATPKSKKKENRRLAGAFAAFIIAVALLVFLLFQGVPALHNVVHPTTVNTATATSVGDHLLSVQAYPTQEGLFEQLSFQDYNSKPIVIDFTATPVEGSSPTSYLWNFGNGANGTSAVENGIVYPANCVYDISLKVTNVNGPPSYFYDSFYDLDSKGPTSVACPQKGTAGITPVMVAGAASAKTPLTIQLDGSNVKNLTTDKNGDWSLNVTDTLPPEVDGTVYNFTTSPVTARGTFLTLEGLAASPHRGEPGANFTLEGRSYPPDTEVSIFLGGEPIGSAVSNGNGSFNAELTVPSTLKYAGTYQFTTSPPVLGAQAYFTVPVTTTTPAAPAPFNWLVWLPFAGAAAAVIIGLVLWRRKPSVFLELFQAEGAASANTGWSIRVIGNRRVKRCRVTYGSTELVTGDPAKGLHEAVLWKDSMLVFPIPEGVAIDWSAAVVVADGDRQIKTQKLGSIERTKP